ncbi:solute carrier family 38 member 10-like [Montipora capricornis]|uniref:solute carrier family 38 member 10-like n=1 Tax=Montipora capricornis TaxID=246305 RepID=UPI0035F20EAA
MSTRHVVFNLVNCIIGVSVLAMPFCFQECGIILCVAAIISSSWLTKKSCELLLKAGQVSRRRNYEGLALATYGTPGKLVVETSIIGLLIGTLIAMNVIIGDLVPSIFHNLSGVEVSWTVRAVLMTILAFGVGLPLSLMRNLHSLASFSFLSLIFYMGFVLQIFFSALPGILEGSWVYDLNYWRPENLLHSLPIFALAFSCQSQLFALYETLPEPSVKKMEGVIHTGINIVAAVYFSVGFFGYICFYSIGVQGDMLNNYGNTMGSLFIKFGFVMSVIVSFPLMVYPLRASLHSLIFQESSNSDNLPGGTGFIPHDRFTYMTVGIISATLLLGILFPQIEFVLALTGATMGAMIAFIFPSNIYLHIVSEQTSSRPIAKLVLVLGLVCFVTGTYTVLMNDKSMEPGHQVDIHPPGIDPIQPVAVHDFIEKQGFIRDANQQENHTNLLINGGAVDVDVAKIGLEGDHALKVDGKLGVENLKPVEAKPLQIDDAANEGLKLKADEPAEPVEGKEKRQEPPVPHAPPDKNEQDAPDEHHKEDEQSKDKRQLMSNGEEPDKSSDHHEVSILNEGKVDEMTANRNAVDANQVKVSEQEINEELKKLEQKDKVSVDVSMRQGGEKETGHTETTMNEWKPKEDSHEKSSVKRDADQLLQRSAKDDDTLAASDNSERKAREDVSVSKTFQNQTSLQDKKLDTAENKELSDTLELFKHQRPVLRSENNTLLKDDGHNTEQSVKIRDLKSNGKPMKVSSKSWRTFLSKQHSDKSKRSKLQGKAR